MSFLFNLHFSNYFSEKKDQKFGQFLDRRSYVLLKAGMHSVMSERISFNPFFPVYF
jgi:hypothetical protein